MQGSLLDLPESTLECILECLSPSELCKVATLCTLLRDKCKSDYLWERIMKQKWGRLIGAAAHREWQRYVALRKTAEGMGRCNPFESSGSFHGDWPILTIASTSSNTWRWSNSVPDDSITAWCVSIESGRFWFPAQLYKEDNAGMMMYWYDTLLCYDFRTDNFRARCPHDGWGRTLTDIEWDEVRAPVVDVSPFVVHISDCLNELMPGDHIEIQWKQSKKNPYDWWYAVIGHLESCERHRWNHCNCCYSDILIVEFNQYTPDSPRRRVVLNRKDGSMAPGNGEGYYGGIRKLQSEEIARWKKML